MDNAHSGGPRPGGRMLNTVAVVPWLALLWLGFTPPQEPATQTPASQPAERQIPAAEVPPQQGAPVTALGEDLVVGSLTVVGADGRPRIVLRCDDAGVARIEIRDAEGLPRLTAEVAGDGTAAALLGANSGRGLYGIAPVEAEKPLSLAFLDPRGKPRMVFGVDKQGLPFADLLDKLGEDRIGMRVDDRDRGTLEVKDDEGRVEGGIVGR